MNDYQRHQAADHAEQNAIEFKTKLVIAEYLERKDNEIKYTRAELKATHDWDYHEGICRVCAVSMIEWDFNYEGVKENGCERVC